MYVAFGRRPPSIYHQLQRGSNIKRMFLRRWCTNCQNLKEEQYIYIYTHTIPGFAQVHHGFGARIVGFDLGVRVFWGADQASLTCFCTPLSKDIPLKILWGDPLQTPPQTQPMQVAFSVQQGVVQKGVLGKREPGRAGVNREKQEKRKRQKKVELTQGSMIWCSKGHLLSFSRAIFIPFWVLLVVGSVSLLHPCQALRSQLARDGNHRKNLISCSGTTPETSAKESSRTQQKEWRQIAD